MSSSLVEFARKRAEFGFPKRRRKRKVSMWQDNSLVGTLKTGAVYGGLAAVARSGLNAQRGANLAPDYGLTPSQGRVSGVLAGSVRSVAGGVGTGLLVYGAWHTPGAIRRVLKKKKKRRFGFR